MQKTKIEWCDSTWNPVTGCLHGCEYCYARRIAERFGGHTPSGYGKIQVIDSLNRTIDGKPDVYPFGFLPTFHRYKLDEPQHWKKPRTIFVCSMADLFGDWVPDDWIEAVFKACRDAPQHRYLFLTKNIQRYIELLEAGKLPDDKNFWYGCTVTNPEMEFFYAEGFNIFLSIEPLLAPFDDARDAMWLNQYRLKWFIIGAMTGPGSEGKQPKSEWVENIVGAAKIGRIPVFMKHSLVPIVGEGNMRREFPWKMKC